MDTLNTELAGVETAKPRDIVFGPCLVHARSYGVSLMLPKGWIAATLLGEVYGIEPLSRNDGRIYVTSQIASVTDVIRSLSKPLDFGVLALVPTSIPFVDSNQVSVHASVQGMGMHTSGFVTTKITANNKAVTFAALFDEPTEDFFRGVVADIAGSVRDIRK